MRARIRRQLSLTPQPIDHEHSREMAAIGAVLDAHPELAELVESDLLGRRANRDAGRCGMTADQVLRALVVKQMRQLSYEELAFHLADSSTYRAFCRFGAFDSVPRKSALQDNLRRVSAQTLERVNRTLVAIAMDCGVERADKVRVDTTPSRTNIHEPSDSSLLWDVVRVLVREMYAAWQLVDFIWTDHRRRAKRRTVAIISARKQRRERLYRDLLDVARRTVGYAESALEALRTADYEHVPCAERLEHYLPLAERVIDQTHRRVIDGESVPADEKLLSIFETDTDIIVRGRRDPTYGHKLSLTIGASSMVLDCVVETGNPTDSTLATRMIERIKTIAGTPRQAVFDGGFSSQDNVDAIKQLGVDDVAFTKHLGIAVSEMVRSSWVFKRLRRFRAGVEGCISFLKRCFGLARCTWRGGRDGFAAYVWSAILSANLLTMARHQLSQ